MVTRVEQRLEQLKQALKEVPIDAMFETVTQANTATIEQKNIDQLDAGLDGEGKPITPEYSPFTVAAKKKIGAVWDRVTLEHTGAFRASIAPDIQARGFEMVASDNKWGILTEMYGDVVKLNPQSKEELKQEVYKPGILEQLKNYFDRIL